MILAERKVHVSSSRHGMEIKLPFLNPNLDLPYLIAQNTRLKFGTQPTTLPAPPALEVLSL